jgi:hypothetical protein
MGVDQQVLYDFRETIRKDFPKFQVGVKDQSWLMEVCGFLARPFNDTFMTRFTTTLGHTVYFPSDEWYESDPDRAFRVLAHEYVHLFDQKKHWSFQGSYISPQILAVVPLATFMVLAWPWSWLVVMPVVGYLLACLVALWSKPASWVVLAAALIGFGVGAWFLVGWKLGVLLGGLLFLCPWPAPWRTKWELRGYTMNAALAVWSGRWSEVLRDRSILNFTGPNYFFMCWSGSKIRDALDRGAEKARSGELQRDPPYSTVHDFLRQRHLMGC